MYSIHKWPGYPREPQIEDFTTPGHRPGPDEYDRFQQAWYEWQSEQAAEADYNDGLREEAMLSEHLESGRPWN